MTETKELANITGKIEQVLMAGDLKGLTSEEKVIYHNRVCESLGLNPLTKPFEYIQLNGKLQLYAKKDATDQLRRIYGISIKIVSREQLEGLIIVTASAVDKSGRTDEATGIVNIQGLKGDGLANAFMKAETKAKRRVTLSICGLGMLDESELEDIPKNSIDVTPKNTHFLTESKQSHDSLVQAFMGLGVSKDDILRTYGIESLSELEQESVDELRRIYKDIKSGEKSKDDYFLTEDVTHDS